VVVALGTTGGADVGTDVLAGATGTDTTVAGDTAAGIAVVDAVLATASLVVAGGIPAAARTDVVATATSGVGTAAVWIAAPASADDAVPSSASAGAASPSASESDAAAATSRREPPGRGDVARSFDVGFRIPSPSTYNYPCTASCIRRHCCTPLQSVRKRSSFEYVVAAPSVWVGDSRTRTRVIERHLPLVRVIARRFVGRGEPLDDLVQVGNVALIAAVDRCERGREGEFAAYAAACVEGEIRRHLRDRCDPLRVPRRLHADVELMALLRSPVTLDDETDMAATGEPDDDGLDRVLVASAARSLDARERRVLALRYFCDLSQAEIGDEIGVSQAHVSRLLEQALRKMRLTLAGDGATASESARSRIGSLSS
jgi:RNA polymerase sigma-B factor